MSYWSLAVNETGQDGQPVFNTTRSLTDHEFERLSAANEVLRKRLDQTTWSVLQYNYACFALLERQLRDDIAARSTTSPMQADTIQVPIVASIVNFLTAMRMFLDQSEAELKRLDDEDNGNRFSAWKTICSAEYDEFFAYRFLYKFRNYVQHIGLPLSIWNISVSLKRSDEIIQRSLSGELSLDDVDHSEDPIVQILLGESPADLISNYGNWPAPIKAELESLTTEIDLSEQIHVVMECLTRIAEAFQEQFEVELLQAVKDFKAIVGNLTDYRSRPVLAHITEKRPRFDIEIMDLEFERFLQAESLVASTVD